MFGFTPDPLGIDNVRCPNATTYNAGPRPLLRLAVLLGGEADAYFGVYQASWGCGCCSRRHRPYWVCHTPHWVRQRRR